MNEQELEFERTLDESKTLLEGASREADEDFEFTLEGILAEYGIEGTGQTERSPEDMQIPEDAAPLKPAVTIKMPGAERPAEPEKASAEEAAGPVEELAPEVDEPQSFSLQEVLARTVQEVLEEQKEEPVIEEPQRRGLFSRKKPKDTEELYEKEEEPPQPEPEEAHYEPPEEPEPPLDESAEYYKEEARQSRTMAWIVTALTLLMWVPPALQHFGMMPEAYAAEPLLNTLPFFAAELLICVFGREVFLWALDGLRSLRFTYELLTSLLCIATLADTALAFMLPGRAEAAAMPLHSIAALAMTCALWGHALRFEALYDTFRIAAIGDAPYMVTNTAGGAAKRSGGVAGFTDMAEREDAAERWQKLVLPVIVIAVLVFSVLSTMESRSWTLYAWNLSAVLAGASALGFPLAGTLPLRCLTKRLAKAGSAVAGYAGANSIRRSNCLILTDSDLFPPGTVTLNGIKIFGEESGKVISYAATMAHASDSGLTRLFDDLLSSEGGTLQPLSDLNFFEEGGVGGTIHGETVLFGTSSFCRQMGITLPHGLSLKTGVFLAVDGTLIAVFAVKYMPAENVDWALHALGRARITPVLAVRDGNMTPDLLRRKFGTDAHAVFPALSTRLALSERSGARPCALLYREGLTPYAELAVGSKRLCRAVRVATTLTLIASVAGTVLSFYLSFAAAYTLFTPFSLLAYMLLWLVASLVDGVFVDRY